MFDRIEACRKRIEEYERLLEEADYIEDTANRLSQKDYLSRKIREEQMTIVYYTNEINSKKK